MLSLLRALFLRDDKRAGDWQLAPYKVEPPERVQACNDGRSTMTTPICADCKHHLSNMMAPHRFCKRVDHKIDIVTGATLFVSAYRARAEDGQCGPEGKLFEAAMPAKTGWFQRAFG